MALKNEMWDIVGILPFLNDSASAKNIISYLDLLYSNDDDPCPAEMCYLQAMVVSGFQKNALIYIENELPTCAENSFRHLCFTGLKAYVQIFDRDPERIETLESLAGLVLRPYSNIEKIFHNYVKTLADLEYKLASSKK